MRSTSYEDKRISINLARLKKQGHVFEIDIDPDMAEAYIERQPDVEISDVLKAESVFADAKKGQLASESEMESVFGTSEPLEVAKKILAEGEIQLTSEHRRKQQEKKYRKVLDVLHRNSIDPRSKAPHPVQRLERALEEAKIKIDPHKPVETQVNEIVKKLRPILPIKFGTIKIAITLPAQYAAKGYGTISSYGNLKKEEWRTDGSWYAVIELPSGMQNEFYEKLNSLTHGEAESTIIES